MRDMEKRRAYAREYNAQYRLRLGQKLLDKKRKQSREWRAANREEKCAQSREYYRKNKEKVLAINIAWRTANPEKARAKDRRREIALQKSRPRNQENSAILRLIRAEARHRGLVVDHVIPIQGRGVCGLNVYWNTQLLTKEQNGIKHNHY